MLIPILFLLTLAVCALLYVFLGNPLLIRLLHDARGQLNGLLDHALANRPDLQCNMPRIPTGAFPAFSKTIGGTLDANGNATIELEAERDLLLFGLSADVADAAPRTATLSATYCGTKILVNSSVRTWPVCCDRKPPFGLGVREDKSVEFTVNGGTPAGAFAITVHGLQGNGCCG